jgi:hypothetical protein
MAIATWSEIFWANPADATAIASFTSEKSLLTGLVDQPSLPALFWQGPKAASRVVRLIARGVLSSSAIPTYTFQWRLNTTAGVTNLAGASVGVSIAITTQSGVTNSLWESTLDILCKTPGIGTGNATLTCAGTVSSWTGFAAPYTYELEPTTPPTATWTQTVDGSLQEFINLSVTSSASNASNTLQLKQLFALCRG